jgi:hypothetical protein
VGKIAYIGPKNLRLDSNQQNQMKRITVMTEFYKLYILLPSSGDFIKSSNDRCYLSHLYVTASQPASEDEFNKNRILLVDDDADIVEILKNYFSNFFISSSNHTM